MEQETNPSKTNELTKNLLIVAVIGGLFVIGVTYAIKVLVFSDEPEVRKVVEKVIEEKEVLLRAPKCEGTFEEYRNLVSASKSVTLTNKQRAYASNGLQGTKTITVIRSGESEVACGYLYVRASRVGGTFQKQYDSIYINPHDFGGHLLRPRSIEFKKESDKKAEILLPLREMPYIPKVPYDPESQNFKVADWVKLLNVSNETSFILGLSVANGEGLIEEAVIAYRCWDPQTGKETTTCQLGLRK